MGDQKDVRTYLKAVCFDEEVEAMEQGQRPSWAAAVCVCQAARPSVWHWRELYAIKRSC